jgi:hypothetical protein
VTSRAVNEARDALVAVHNLAALTRSPKIARPRVAEVLPEIVGSCAALRRAFDAGGGPARAELRAFAHAALSELERALDAAQGGDLDTRVRLTLERAATRAGGDLEAATGLLELAERAESHAPIEQSLHDLARASLSALPIRRQPTLRMKLDMRGADATVMADAGVLGRLLLHLAALVRCAGAPVVVLRPRADGARACFVVEAATAADDSLAAERVALARRVAPTDAVISAAAAAAGATLRIERARSELSLPRA